jgi:N-acetylglutamate synthase-like GNAT family acetyltransferase
MAARRLTGTTVCLRRARRRDRGKLESLLGRRFDARERRGLRRLLADLRCDVYVAEDSTGALVGCLSLVYTRSLARGGYSAMLEGLRVQGADPAGVRDALLTYAEERARRRGCRRIAAWIGDHEVHVALRARGYVEEQGLVANLAETCGDVGDRLRPGEDG